MECFELVYTRGNPFKIQVLPFPGGLLGADLVLAGKLSCACWRGWCLRPHTEQAPAPGCEMVGLVGRQLCHTFFRAVPMILQLGTLRINNTLTCLLCLKCVIKPYQ